MAGTWRPEENGSKVTPGEVTAAARVRTRFPCLPQFRIRTQGSVGSAAFGEVLRDVCDGGYALRRGMAKPPNYSRSPPFSATETGSKTGGKRGEKGWRRTMQWPSPFPGEDQRPIAAMPARAICASSDDFTPETPMAPTHSLPTMIGTPPSSIPSSDGAERKE